MVKSFRLEEESMGDMKRICPFCKSRKISFYDAYNTCVFKDSQQYICHNCGCVFEEDTVCRDRLITTEISKEEFLKLFIRQSVILRAVTFYQKRIRQALKRNIQVRFKPIIKRLPKCRQRPSMRQIVREENFSYYKN